jgi:ABC-type uncharacterized transport system substrate-binding protein
LGIRERHRDFYDGPVRDVTELERAIAAAARGSGGGLIIPADPFIAANLQLIVRLAEQLNLPAVSIYRQYSVDGGLISYGADTLDIFIQDRQGAGPHCAALSARRRR